MSEQQQGPAEQVTDQDRAADTDTQPAGQPAAQADDEQETAVDAAVAETEDDAPAGPETATVDE